MLRLLPSVETMEAIQVENAIPGRAQHQANSA